MQRFLLSLLKAVAVGLFWAGTLARAASPVAFPDSYTVNEDTTLSVSAPGVLANDTDADGSSFTAVLVSTTTNGTLTLNSSGSFTYRPATNFFGTDTFRYLARETSTRTSAPVIVTITINPVNDAPRVTNNSYSVVSGDLLSIPAPGVLGNDFDVEGDALTATLVSSPANGSLVFNAGGSFDYAPGLNFFGNDSFTYRVSDGVSNSATATVSISVAPQPIVVVTPPQNQSACLGDTVSFSVAATGTALRYQWLKGTTTLTGRTNSTLSLTNVSLADAATYNVRITGATNSITNSAVLTVNSPVQATRLTNYTRFIGSLAIFTTSVTNGSGPFTYAWYKDGFVLPSQTSNSLSLSNLVVEDSGLYSVVITGACGPVTNSATLEVAACFPSVDVMLVIDRSGSMVGKPYDDARAACTNFVRNLRYGPTNDMCGLVAYNTNSILQSRLTNSLSALEMAINNLPPPTNGTRITFGLTNAMGELASPRHRSNALPIIVVMSDGLPNSGDSPSNVLYHAQLAKNAGVRIFTVGLGDVDHVLMSGAASSTNDYFYTTNSSDLKAFFDTISAIICRPPTNILGPVDAVVCVGGSATFEVRASGCEGFTYQWRKDGIDLIGQTNTTYVVNNAQTNQAGVYSVVVSAECRTVTNSATLTVNAPAQFIEPLAGIVSFRDSNVVFAANVSGTGLIYEWRRNGILLGTNNTLALNNLTTNAAGTYCLSIRSPFCGGAVTNCATLVVSNRAPVAVNDSYTVDEDTSLVVPPPGVLGNDTDADGDTLTSIVVTPPVNGTLTLNPDGSLTYTPGTNFNGADTFTYRAGDGASNSEPATVTISVTPVNDAPVANNDAYTMTADTTLTVILPGVLANDTDVEGNSLTAVLVTGPTNGVLTLNADGSFAYRPNTNFSGLDAFTYRANDGAALSGVATATIQVIPVPVVIVTPPTDRTNCPGATTTFSITATGTALSYQWYFNNVELPGVTNRSLAVRNIDATNAGTYCVVVNGAAGGPLTNCAELVVWENVIVTVPPTNLVVCEGTTAEFTVGATGTSLGYQWSFGSQTLTNQTNATLTLLNVGLNAAGTYEVVVSGVCGTPVTNTVELVVNQNVAITVPPTNQTSFVGSNATFSVTAIGTGVTYEWYFNGQLVGTNNTLGLNNLSTNQAGTYCVVVRGVCGAPVTNCNTLTIENRAPFAANDSYTVAEDTTLVIPAVGVLVNDGDIDGDSITAVLVSNPASGSLTFNADGSFNFTPSLNFTGQVTFTYQVSDTKLTSAAATVSITVTPVNDAPVAANDSYVINEDTTLNIPAAGVLANDFDVDGDQLNAVLVSNPASGTLVLTNNGGFSFTPSLNFTGVVTFTYRANDSALNSDAATVTITVLPVNDVPVANNDAYVINEDTSLFIIRPGILANDTDPDGNTLSALLVQNVAHGVLALNPNGSFSYTPNTNYHGVDTFTYRATDGALTSAVATVTITINPTNDVPAAINDDAYTTLEDTTLTILPRGVLTNDIDVDGDLLSAVLVSSTTNGTLTLSNNGAFVYTPSLNYTGVDTFTYRATDGFLTSSVATVTITVLPVNDTPIALNDSFIVNEDTTLFVPPLGVLVNDSDVDGNPLTAVLVSNPASGTLMLTNNGGFAFTPSLNFTGTVTFTYRATDGALSSDVATVTIFVLPVNDTPVAVNDSYTVNEDTTLFIPASGVLANDSDVDGDSLTAVLASNPASGTLVLTNNGGFAFTPSLNFTGVVTFTYRAADSALTSSVATVTITVLPLNDAPVAVNDSYTTGEDTLLAIPSLGVLANDLDVDGNPLSSILVSNVQHGTLILSNNGAFFYQPSLNYTGVDVFTYRATDGALTSGVATVTITIVPTNDVPVAINDFYNAIEDTVLSIPSLGVLTNDFDVDGDPLSTVLVSGPQHGTLTFSNNGAFVYTPSPNYTGVDLFTYRATDGALTSGVAAVTITVLPVNDTPVALNDSYTVNEDTTLNISAPGVLANDSDVDGNPLRAVSVSAPSSGTLNVNTNGGFTFTPSLNFTGAVTFTYRATDGALTSSLATVTITVLPLNDAPVARDDSYRINEDTILNIVTPGLLVNDSDVDGDPLEVAEVVSQPINGVVISVPDGSFLYTPNTNYHGLDTFTYRVTDGALTSGVAIVTITINPTNDAPRAVNDNYTMVEDTTLTVPVRGILTNDIDVDGDLLSAVLVSAPASGTLNLQTNGAFTYTPSQNTTGAITFTYRATDGALTSSVATVTIVITPVNDTPVAVNDSYSVNEDTTLTIPAPGLLANDSDVDGDPLRAVSVSNPSSGVLNVNTNGSFTFTPSLNFTGAVTFTYRATDGALTSSVATVTITVLPVNDVPVANNDSYTIAEDTTLFVPMPGVLANDTDVDGDTLRAVLVSNPSSGTLIVNTNGGFPFGGFVYIPSLNFTGAVTFTYQATDGALTSAVATVTINVTPVNDAPVAVADDAYTVLEDTTLVINPPGVLGNDIDVDGDALTSLLVTNVAHGMLTLSTNGAFVYTPSLNYTGIDTFAYRATDGALTSGVAIVTITVIPTNDAPVAVSDDAYTVLEDTTLTITAPGVLANDIDVDGDPLTALLVNNVAHGMLSLSTNGAFVYTPSLNYTGVDTFTYRATDGALTSGVATVTIRVLPVNDPPVAGVLGDSYSTLEDTALNVTVPGVLANDSDVDGDALTAVLVSGPANGVLTLNANGSFNYIPAANFFGNDSFVYRASDGLTSSAPATVTITVTPVNDAPTFTSGGNQQVNQGATAQTVNWASNITPGPANESGQSVQFLVSNDNPSMFTVAPSISPSGVLTYTPTPNAFGVANVRVRLQDNGGTANGGVDTSAEVIFRIAVNSPPTVSIVSPQNALALLSPATFSVVASANDSDGVVTNVQFLVNGTNFVSIQDGPFFFVMSNALAGNYTFRAIATDNFGLTATSAPVSLDVVTNFVVATGPIVLNFQLGLFEQFVTISNRTSETWQNGVRLFVRNLDTTNKVWNPTGTNGGVPYIDRIVSVPPGGSVTLTVQYYVPNPRSVPTPTLVATPLPFAPPAVTPVITGVSRSGSSTQLQFPTAAGRFYFIQSTTNLVNWRTESVPVAGNGGTAIPTVNHTEPHRFYRLLLVP